MSRLTCAYPGLRKFVSLWLNETLDPVKGLFSMSKLICAYPGLRKFVFLCLN